MPIAVTDTPALPPSPIPPRKRWTRAECETAINAGVASLENVELLDGELIERIGKKRPHSRTFSLVMRWLVGLFGWDYIHAGTPIDVAAQDNDINQPEPDLIVLARHMDVFRSAHPGPTDIRLVVEISDSTLAQDRTIKARLYARGGIAEYWIVDVDGRRVIVHRNPVPDRGEYSSITAYGENEAVATLAAPASPICVTELLVGLE